VPGNEFIDYEAPGIGKMLETHSLAVPFYQRSYSWRARSEAPTSDTPDEKLQVVEYWADISSSFESRAKYFMGTVVLSRDGTEGRESVVDGQQRLATTSLLLAVARDKFRDEGEEKHANSIQQDYLARFDRQASADLPKLILNTEDRDFYGRCIIAGDRSIEPKNHSQRLLLEAFAYLRERVDEFVARQGTNWRDKLNELVTWLVESLQIVSISVATEADAFMIFETLNDRGADLTIADLLKNYLFSKAGPRLDEVRDNWVRTLSNLDIDKVGNQRFTTFARHLLSSKYGRVRERDVYGRLKTIVQDSPSAVDFSQELKDASRIYFALLASDSDFWVDYAASTADAADVLVAMGLEQHRPLLLAVLTKFSRPEVEKFMPAMVSWALRGLVAGTLGAGSAETAFCDAAREVRSGAVTTAAEVLLQKGLDALVPTDAVFEPLFADWRTTRATLARYVLRSLELQRRGEPDPELVVNKDVEAVNLEHILPKGARVADWPQFTAEEKSLYVDRIGNMCLLQKGPNARIGNKPWSVKQPVLARSGLLLTSEAAVAPDWTAAVIVSRQSDLAKLAVLTWPRDPR
jgi:uncharacterized protein with ParB-like and HNH nuclease domain